MKWISMTTHANDNAKARTIEPFHRLFAERLLHKSRNMNDALYYCGQRFERSFRECPSTSIQSPDYTKDMVSCGSYDPYRDVPIAERRVDKSRPYFEAKAILSAVGLLELVEAIVIHGQSVVEAGKTYSGRKHEAQARSAAITALGIGLLLLRNHYLPSAKLAAA